MEAFLLLYSTAITGRTDRGGPPASVPCGGVPVIYNPPLRKMLWMSFLAFGAPVYVWWAHDWLVTSMHQNLPPQLLICAPAGLMLFAWGQWLANWIHNLRGVNRT